MPESSRLSWRTIALSTALALAAATFTVVVLSDDDDAVTTGDEPAGSIELTPDEDVPSADDVSFLTFDDQEVPLTSLEGTPTVVNFFASTCTPCITEMPAFEEVHKELADEPVAFLGLAVTDRADDALALVEQTGVTYPTAQDPDASVITALGGSVLPTTVLLGADGEILATRHGEIDADELRSMIADELGISA